MTLIKEMIDYYSSEGELLGSMEKKRMHEQMRKEFLKTGKVSVRHKHVLLILMNSKGRIILQKRSKWKGDNPGLWDKTVGGHVSSGDSYDLTMLKECAEELGIPATIVDKKEFEHAASITDLQILGILTRVLSLDHYQPIRSPIDHFVQSGRYAFRDIILGDCWFNCRIFDISYAYQPDDLNIAFNNDRRVRNLD